MLTLNRPSARAHERIKIKISSGMRYVSVTYAIANNVVLPGSTAIICASVVGPVVSFEENWVVPVVM